MNEYINNLVVSFSTPTMEKIIETIIVIVIFSLLRWIMSFTIGRNCKDTSRCYYLRRNVKQVYAILLIIAISYIWISSFESIATFLGIASAGIAIALHDAIANMAGWIFILSRTPFKVGDRIQIGKTSGDVIDIRLFQFSVIEMGNWVQADQSTGRIVHIPNSIVLKEPLANYETGFDYIWHEIPVTVTFESNWEKAKRILTGISEDKTEKLSNDAQAQIRRAAMKYLIYYKHLTPIVYTTVLGHGISLTIRYIIKPRQRRSSEEKIWEAILTEFAKHNDISLAYPTTRFYTQETLPTH